MLAGNCWHTLCFTCNACGTLPDKDVGLSLYENGSLLCDNCTYSCSTCWKKIEDLTILTVDQAFCTACFKCCNCKTKIASLQYAQNSQGIFCMDCSDSCFNCLHCKSKIGNTEYAYNSQGVFCMDCHESLIIRRRKKQMSKRMKRSEDGVRAPLPQLQKDLPNLPKSLLPHSVP